MKKYLFLIVMLLVSAALFGCGKKEEGIPDLPNHETDWGLEISLKDVTRTGVTLMFEHNGDVPEGELNTGQEYRLLEYKNQQWIPVEYAVDTENLCWDSAAYIINKNDKTEFEEDWSYLYGKLSKGTYAIEKEVLNWRAPGDYDKELYYAIFEIK